MDTDDKLETLTSYLTKNNINWPQATHASIKDLAETTYCIQEYPSTILLGPDGRVVILDQKALQGDQLIKTLDVILPK